MNSIIHINHSSLCFSNNDGVLITDPWYFVNAFHGWAPFPQPDAGLINQILSDKRSIKVVLISHAHDDHLDKVFLSLLDKSTIIVCPRDSAPSLKSDIAKAACSGITILEASEEPLSTHGFQISCICNHTLSSQDFIFTVKTDDYYAVHANDNWHKFSESVVSHLLALGSDIPHSHKYFFAQVGVADSFPMYYQGISRNDKIKIIQEKCERMISAILWNGCKVGISNIYSYANQSIFETPDIHHINPYLIRDDIIKGSAPAISQLHPSCSIDPSGSLVLKSDYTPLIDYRLDRLTALFAQYLSEKYHSSRPSPLLEVYFWCDSHSARTSVANDRIVVASSLHQWNRILSGECNLESIITGGCGSIALPSGYNMRREYGLLVDWSYKLQALIKAGKVII
jgi:hypothetical protein